MMSGPRHCLGMFLILAFAAASPAGMTAARAQAVALEADQFDNLGVTLGRPEPAERIPILSATARVVIPASAEFVVAAPQAGRVMGLSAAAGEEVAEGQVQAFTVTGLPGQRQRLLIARALVNRPRILVFDEATSALDNRTQQLVSDSLGRRNVTRVVIAHRLSTVREASRIYVLDEGRIVQQGTYAELHGAPGPFARMMARQTV